MKSITIALLSVILYAFGQEEEPRKSNPATSGAEESADQTIPIWKLKKVVTLNVCLNDSKESSKQNESASAVNVDTIDINVVQPTGSHALNNCLPNEIIALLPKYTAYKVPANSTINLLSHYAPFHVHSGNESYSSSTSEKDGTSTIENLKIGTEPVQIVFDPISATVEKSGKSTRIVQLPTEVIVLSPDTAIF